MTDLKLNFTAELWAYDGPGAWHFLTLPADAAERINFLRERRPGFGTVRVKATIGDTEWKTSLFPDGASHTFLLPVKAEVRKMAGLAAGDPAEVTLLVDP